MRLQQNPPNSPPCLTVLLTVEINAFRVVSCADEFHGCGVDELCLKKSWKPKTSGLKQQAQCHWTARQQKGIGGLLGLSSHAVTLHGEVPGSR